METMFSPPSIARAHAILSARVLERATKVDIAPVSLVNALGRGGRRRRCSTVVPPNDRCYRGCKDYFVYGVSLSTSFQHIMSCSHFCLCHKFIMSCSHFCLNSSSKHSDTVMFLECSIDCIASVQEAVDKLLNTLMMRLSLVTEWMSD
ncbi:hypothetical protein PS2_026910 [Malus domestica]